MADKRKVMDRREFLGSLAAGAAALGLSRYASLAAQTSTIAATAGAGGKERLNVLFIVSDDLNDWVGAFGGHPQTQTPNIDRLCRRGVTFERAYTCSPLCNPSRVALLTGKMPSSTGVYDNRQPFRQAPAVKDAVTLPQYMMRHGYYSAGAGKIYHGHFPDPPSWNDYASPGGAKPKDENITTVAKVTWGPIDEPESQTSDARIADYCIQQLGKAHDKPFFLACGFRKPHLPWFAPRKYFEKFPPDKIVLPKVKDDDLDDVPPIGRKWAAPKTHEIIKESGKWPEAVAAYLATINFVDAQVGRLLDALDASPYANNTAIVFWGDHGWHLGEKLHWAKSTLWEEADRAPLAVFVPGMAGMGGRCPRTVSFLDIYPALVDACGLPPKDDLEGLSLRPLLENPAAEWERPARTDFHFGNHSIRGERWRYTRYVDGGEELYDHDADEMEWTNLADDPAHADVKRDLARWLPKTQTPDAPHQYFPGDKELGQAAIDRE